jgi:hypothetical protein
LKPGKAKPKASKVSKANPGKQMKGGQSLTSFFAKKQIGCKPKSAK